MKKYVFITLSIAILLSLSLQSPVRSTSNIIDMQPKIRSHYAPILGAVRCVSSNCPGEKAPAFPFHNDRDICYNGVERSREYICTVTY